MSLMGGVGVCQFQDFTHLLANSFHGVERGHGILGDQADPPAILIAAVVSRGMC